MPSTDRKLELTAKASMAQSVSQTTVCCNGLRITPIFRGLLGLLDPRRWDQSAVLKHC